MRYDRQWPVSAGGPPAFHGCGCASSDTRGRGGLGKMTRGPKRKILRLTNERDFPNLVELALPPEGFRSVLLEIDAFHRD